MLLPTQLLKYSCKRLFRSHRPGLKVWGFRTRMEQPFYRRNREEDTLLEGHNRVEKTLYWRGTTERKRHSTGGAQQRGKDTLLEGHNREEKTLCWRGTTERKRHSAGGAQQSREDTLLEGHNRVEKTLCWRGTTE